MSVFYITGMHSSGTSLTSGYLHHCGINMFINSHRTNSLYEHYELRKIGHKILNTNNYHRYEFNELMNENRLTLDSITKDLIYDETNRFTKYSKRHLIENWGFKTPINSLCIWVWIPILLNFISNIKIILVYREPEEVIDSFMRRKSKSDLQYIDYDAKKLEFIWYNYNQSVYNFYLKNKDNNRLEFYFFNIRDIINNPEKFTEMLGVNYKDFSDIYQPKKLLKNNEEIAAGKQTLDFYNHLEKYNAFNI